MRYLPPLLAALCGCSSARTPEGACERFVQGVRQGDGAQVFDALLQSTQWSLYTVAKAQREMRGLITDAYPPGPRAEALGRLWGGQSSSGRDLFQRLYPQRYAPAFQRRLGTGPLRVEREGDGARCGREGGEPFRFARARSGRWGMAELDREWEQAKLRAVHDLDTVRENASLYRQAQKRPPTP